MNNALSTGCVDIWLDEIVPCLKDTETGEIKETVVFKIESRSFLRKFREKDGWGINWIDVPGDVEVYALALKENNTTPYVIVNSRQHNVLPSNFERTFHRISKNAGIGQYGVHALRHTFASMLFRNHVDVKIVSQLLGHSSVKITYDTYVHLFEKDIQRVTNVLD